MLGEDYGVARGTALSNAGTITLKPMIAAQLAVSTSSAPKLLNVQPQSKQGTPARLKKRKWGQRKKAPKPSELD